MRGTRERSWELLIKKKKKYEETPSKGGATKQLTGNNINDDEDAKG